MDRTPFRSVLLLAAALVVALAGFMSAARLTPVGDDMAMAAHVETGGSHHAHDDHSGNGSSHDDHHCPFCRLLSDPPDIRFAPGLRRATPTLVWQDLGHLIARAQAGNPHVSARAPPVPV